jgi:hypothetical protein
MRIVNPPDNLPTDNDLGIPCLRADRQGQLIHPAKQWGSVSRGASMYGTWSFYCDDYRFAALYGRGVQGLPGGCKSAIELNITVLDSHPMWHAIWATAVKRRCSRQWQDAGLGVIVDLCVPARYSDVNLLGVPIGWETYATRGYAARPGDVEAECEVARRHGGEDTVVYVIGGGETIRHECCMISNAVYVEQSGVRNVKG